MYFEHLPTWVQRLFPSITWSSPDKSRYYLTFDDGPHPDLTPKILDVLDAYDAKATFFFLGSSVDKYPELYQETIRRGHSVGHHTYDHLSGWTTPAATYLKNIENAKAVIDSPLFRPPYGRINPFLLSRLSKSYRIILWDYMVGDFNAQFSLERFHKNIERNVSRSSIAVLHENDASLPNVLPALEALLNELHSTGRKTETITQLLQSGTI